MRQNSFFYIGINIDSIGPFNITHIVQVHLHFLFTSSHLSTYSFIMDVIGQNIAKLVDERLKEALRERDIKIQALEEDKRKLTRLASDMKNDVKNMKITIDMYEKSMLKNKIVHRCHKGIQCNMFRGLPLYLSQSHVSETNSSTSRSPRSENCESSNDLNSRETPQRCNNENEIGPRNHSSSSSCPDRTQIVSPMSLGERVDEQAFNGDDPMDSRPSMNSDQSTLANVRKRNSRNNVEIIDLSDEENNNDKYEDNQTGGLNNDNKDQVNFPIPKIKEEFIAPKIEIMPGSTKLEPDGKHSTVFVITHDSVNSDPKTRNIDHYEVYMSYRKPGNLSLRDEKKIGTVQPSFPNTAIHFNANHLQSGVEYHFRVKAVDTQNQIVGHDSENCVFFVPNN